MESTRADARLRREELEGVIADFLGGDVGDGLVDALELATSEHFAAQRPEDQPVVEPLVGDQLERAVE